MTNRKRVFWATTALFSGLIMAGAASAQSTGSQTVETTELDTVVVTGNRTGIDGAIVAQRNPRSTATVTDQYIQTQNAGQTPLAAVNLVPGVNFTNTDAYGSSGGDVTMRGFDSARISLTVDGIPLNDTGNYAIYTNQQPDPETLSRIGVNLGTTEVDSPTASATGGTINMVTRRPASDFGVTLVGSVGDESFNRYFAMIDTGEIGPWGTAAWFSYSQTEYDHFNALFGVDKKQFNGRIYQPLGDNGDFISLSGHYNENRNFFGNQQVSLAQFNQGLGYTRPTYVPGSTQTGINPSNTGNIRGQSRFTLGEGLRLTVDPSFQYTLAHGGGNNTWTRAQLDSIGGVGSGDLVFTAAGAAPTATTVTLARPNITNTHRYSVLSSLIWDINDSHQIRAAYTYEFGRHRQTGQQGYLTNGMFDNWFAGRDGEPVRLQDGSILRRRDRLSHATLNQFSLEYRGSFVEDTVDLVVGLRAPFFKRELNNYCYQRDTSNALCTNVAPTVVSAADGTVRFPTITGPYNTPTNANHIYGVPGSFERKYDDLLPNVGLTWRFAPNQSVYTSYAEGISAPRTDDLYDRTQSDPVPETTKTFDLGYRYQSGTIIASVAAWRTDYKNRIVRVFDEVEGESYSRNQGEVTLQGIDGQIGWSPVDGFSLYASASYLDSEIKNDLPPITAGGAPIPTAGKMLFETPEWQYGLRAQYELADFVFGLQGKYVGERFANDINSEIAPDYTVVDMDLRYTPSWLSAADAYLQLNVSNLFDKRYLADIRTFDPNGTGAYHVGAPRTAMLTLGVAF
ncbi:TonB-dependent receptor domain-containing protein [Brevundimonas sp. GCM10030266]|uniref:TonB-dependent receptor domain-containing protein n=1 Tax=Brevundimonas sp. GCM10030266 TaxID=3273386 RepID=UPI00360C4FA3